MSPASSVLWRLLVAAAALTVTVWAAPQRPQRDPARLPQTRSTDLFATVPDVAVARDGQPASVWRLRADAEDRMRRAAETRSTLTVPTPNGPVTFEVTYQELHERGLFVAGPVDGDPNNGEVSVLVRDGRLLGRIVANGTLSTLRHDEATGAYVAQSLDQQAFPTELQPRVPFVNPDAGVVAADRALSLAGDTNGIVDLLVVYTPAARSAIGGTAAMETEIAGAVSNANLALANAGAVHRFRLAHQAEVTYTEAGSSDLDRLTDPDDGYMDVVHRLRDDYDADIVSMVGTSNACGVGWLMQSVTSGFQSHGFNVNHYTCIFGNFTMAHEIGHNMGLNHDRANVPRDSLGNLQQGSAPYAYGYRVNGHRDVMAYDCSLPTSTGFSCPRRAIFSTPLQNFPTSAVPAGVADSEDNTRALNDVSLTVANFRDSTCSYTLSAGTTSFSASGGTTTVSVTTGTGCAWTAVSVDTTMATLTGTLTRVGSGSFTATVSSSASGRSTTVHAGGQAVTLTQGTVCTPTVTVSSSSFTRSGGTGTATVSYPSGCTTSWTAASNQSFLTITSGASGAGSGSVGFSVAANTAITSRTATLTIAGVDTTITQTGATLTASPTTMAFAATKNGAAGAVVAVTEAQRITLTHSGSAASSWSASSNVTWLQITNGSGTGSGVFTVGVVNPSNVIGASTSLSGTITITATNVGNSPVQIPVTLTVTQTTTGTAVPFGAFDTPVSGATVAGSIAVTGWALDDIGIDRVEIWRDRISGDPAPPFQQTGHPADGKVFIANGTFVEGTRPDVASLYSTHPARHRAGWGYLLLTQGFPNRNGTFVLTAIAWDEEGQSRVLGTSTITVNNAASTKPFGSIDVPAYGATFSGHNFTFGWALTPVSGCTVSGGSRTMTIDSVPASGSTPYGITYGSNRTDIAASFPGFSDSNSAGGAAALDSRTYANGTYQIGWLVYDSCGNGEGIGSRFFTILNTSSDAARASQEPRDARASQEPRDFSPGGSRVIRGRGPTFARVGQAADPGTSALQHPGTSALQHSGTSALRHPGTSALRDPLWLVRGLGEPEQPIASGATVWLSQTGRIEVHVTRPGVAPADGVRYEGYLVADDELRSLPLGSSFDVRTGSFYWQPVAGFLGMYHVRILAVRGETVETWWDVPVEVGPEAEAVHLQIDRSGCAAEGCALEGWAADPRATTGSGIGHVHAWATVEGTPVFVGAATLGLSRPDVAARYGAQFATAGYVVPVTGLPPGTHLVTIYAWSVHTARWEIARVVTVTVQ